MRSHLLRLSGGFVASFALGSSVAEAKTPTSVVGLHDGDAGSWGLKFNRDWDKDSLALPEANLFGKNSEPSTARGYRSIVLVRHGQYYLETGELTDLGRRQAERSAERVASLCEGLGLSGYPTSLVVSSATRTMQTSQPFIKTLGLTPEVDDQLRECWPSLAFDRENTRSPEDVKRGHAQAEGAYKRLFRRPASSKHNEIVVVVAHANVIRYWMLRALQLAPEAWTILSIPHASITHIRISPSGNVCVRCMGDSGFLPPDMVTTNNV